MIVKKVRRKQRRVTRVSLLAHAAKLGRYIVDAREADAQALSHFEIDDYAHQLGHYVASRPEKVLATRSPHLRSGQIDEQLAEMGLMIAGVGEDEDPLDHYVLSWAEGDNPTIPEMFDALDILKECLGVGVCPSIDGVHGNTCNPHIHSGILRIDPITGEKIDRPHDGWDIDAAHRALAVIAERYPNWSVTPHRLYEVRNGRMVHRETGSDVGDAADPRSWVRLNRASSPSAERSTNKLLAKIEPHSLQYELDTGFQSRTRVAVEEAIPVMLAAKDWLDAHTQLAQLGIGLELAKNKSGANLAIDGKNVKASTSDRTSLAKLEKRWGTFEARPDQVKVAPYVQRLMFPGDADRALYFAAKREFVAGLKEVIAEVRSAEKGYGSSVPSATCDPSVLMRSAFPTYEAWQAGTTLPDPASVLSGTSPTRGIAYDSGPPPTLRDLAGYSARRTAKGIAYHKIGDLYSRPALFDAGRRIYVNDEEDASILTALRVMAERCPGRALKPFGPPDFIARVAKLAAAEGMLIETGPLGEEAETEVRVSKQAITRPRDSESPTSASESGVARARTPTVPATPDATENSAAASPSPPSPMDNLQEPKRRTSTAVEDEQERPREPARKPPPVQPVKKRQEEPRQPDAQQEAAKAAAAAWAAKWGRG